MAQLSKKIQVPDVEAVRVRQDGDKIAIVLIDKDGAVQMVPVVMEQERAAAA